MKAWTAERTASLRAKRRARWLAGRCVDCGVPMSDRRFAGCEVCRARTRERVRRIYWETRA